MFYKSNIAFILNFSLQDKSHEVSCFVLYIYIIFSRLNTHEIKRIFIKLKGLFFVIDPCFNSGDCIDKLNAYECRCVPGFVGERCERNVYECEPNPCLNNGTCFDMLNVSIL